MKEHVKVHVARYLEPDSAIDAQTLKHELMAYLQTIQPDWQQYSEGARFFPHLTVMDDVPREVATQLSPPLHFISTVATTEFLFDAVAASALRPRLALSKAS